MSTTSKVRAILMKNEPGEAATGGAGSQAPSLLAQAGATWVGECLDAAHPTLQGRAKVRWASPEGSLSEQWLPVLMSVTVRASDRVLMLKPANWNEPVIIGVLDGFARRPERPAQGGPVLEIAPDEALQIQSRSGERVLELTLSEAGPVVRLLSEGVGLHLPGALSISAESIALKARQGEVELVATDDVIVRGATVRLN